MLIMKWSGVEWVTQQIKIIIILRKKLVFLFFKSLAHVNLLITKQFANGYVCFGHSTMTSKN